MVKDILETGQYKGKDFHIRLLYNICANPVGSYGNQKYIIEEILPKINCIVTADMEYSDTSPYSDFLLPACHYFETDWIQGASHTPFLYLSLIHIYIISVKVRDIVIPDELVDVMSLEAQADREKNARMSVASVEADLAEMLADAARAYGDPDAALALRTMLMQYETVKKSGSAVVTVPTAVSDGFTEGLGKAAGRG